MFSQLGFQLYTVRDYIKDEDFLNLSLQKVKALGYTEIHTASVAVAPEVFARAVKNNGMSVCGTHYSYEKIIGAREETMAVHELWGTKNIGIGGMFGDRSSVAALRKFIDEYNAAADYYSKYGYKLTYHNHYFEFVKVPGCDKTMMDILAEELDPKNVSFVLDTCWVARGGADVRYWMEKLAGRLDILHLKDIKAYYEPNGNFTHTMTEIGNGNLAWDAIMETAEKIGVKHYVVEQDSNFATGNPFASLRTSAGFLAKYRK